MKCDEKDGELPVNSVSTDNGSRTGTHQVEQDDDWLTELEHEMKEMAKKWPGAGNVY
ncbi:hypothetical protein [Pantoea dispersa]|uniref:hypothetical protein n=1 Tax=Pantoea dispersa TaxID=59814 RepID=UPI001F5226C3|nr:hypothetical protein [Pantoea dispersa]MCI1030309.1 hypothetical protein [Pantoea dispersa]